MAQGKDRNGGDGVSRRGFLKGMGVGSVATGLIAAAGPKGLFAAEREAVAGPGEVPVTLRINGQARELSVEPRTTLLDALRNRLDLTGSKKVCDRGTCGSCTVLLDGEPAYACSILALEAEGREITTIEGLGTPQRMSALQQAFVEHDGQQCGFCTPGFVVACSAFLDTHPDPNLEEVRAGLGGNLCRCGTYAGVTAAALDAAKAMKGGAS